MTKQKTSFLRGVHFTVQQHWVPQSHLSAHFYADIYEAKSSSVGNLMHSFSTAMNRFNFSAWWVFLSLVILPLQKSFSTQAWVIGNASRAHTDQYDTTLVDAHSPFHPLGLTIPRLIHMAPQRVQAQSPTVVPNGWECILTLASPLLYFHFPESFTTVPLDRIPK